MAAESNALKTATGLGATAHGSTACCIAAGEGHAEVCGLLIAAKANVGVPRRDGAMPSFLALAGGNVECARVLMAPRAVGYKFMERLCAEDKKLLGC
mgnify:CR=1 FL=1